MLRVCARSSFRNPVHMPSIHVCSICTDCGYPVSLTTEHIFIQWLYLSMDNLDPRFSRYWSLGPNLRWRFQKGLPKTCISISLEWDSSPIFPPSPLRLQPSAASRGSLAQPPLPQIWVLCRPVATGGVGGQRKEAGGCFFSRQISR